MGFGKNHTGVIIRENGSAAVGALAKNDAGGQLASPVLTEDFRMLKAQGFAMINDLTAGQGAGIGLYLVNGELSVAEVEEGIEAQGPLDRNDRLPQERAERFIRLVGVTPPHADSANTALPFLNEHGSPMLETKPRWTFSNPECWDWVLYNLGTTLTTGATIDLAFTDYGVWVT